MQYGAIQCNTLQHYLYQIIDQRKKNRLGESNVSIRSSDYGQTKKSLGTRLVIIPHSSFSFAIDFDFHISSDLKYCLGTIFKKLLRFKNISKFKSSN